MIKILTGWSDKGGSTFAFINLVNKLNESGYDTTLYGPHSWHLDKCKSDNSNNLKLVNDDILVTHFIQLPYKPNCKKIILSCHETNIFELSKVKRYWDTVVFLNEKQRKYHSKYKGPYEIIPNLKEELVIKEKKPELDNVAGIIGSIDENKQTHISILRALEDNCTKIYLFGNITDYNYYNSMVKPLIEGNQNIIEYGFIEDKNKMYEMIGRVYLSSIREVAPLVKDECMTNGTKFFGNEATNHDEKKLTNDEIIKEWVKIFDL